jgi:hypothetical protein
MSRVAIKGAETGTGVFTLESPATNTDRVLVLPDEAGTVLTTAGVPASAMPAGSVLQVIETSVSTRIDTTGTYPQTSGIQLSITPSSSSSKILVSAVLASHCVGNGSNTNKIGIFGIKNQTSGTQLNLMRIGANLSSSGADVFVPVSFLELDSPNSTSAQTYEILLGRLGGTFDNNVVLNDYSGTNTTITLMEIAA